MRRCVSWPPPPSRPPLPARPASRLPPTAPPSDQLQPHRRPLLLFSHNLTRVLSLNRILPSLPPAQPLLTLPHHSPLSAVACSGAVRLPHRPATVTLGRLSCTTSLTSSTHTGSSSAPLPHTSPYHQPASPPQPPPARGDQQPAAGLAHPPLHAHSLFVPVQRKEEGEVSTGRTLAPRGRCSAWPAAAPSAHIC